MTKQGEKIQAWADLAGITPRDYTGTFHAAADAIGIPPGPTDARMVTYLQRLTGSDETNLMNLEALAAKQRGADHWGALGLEVGDIWFYEFDGSTMYATIPDYDANGLPTRIAFEFNANAPGTGRDYVFCSSDGKVALSILATSADLQLDYTDADGTTARTVTGPTIAAATRYQGYAQFNADGVDLVVNGTTYSSANAPSPPANLTNIASSQVPGDYFDGKIWNIRATDDSPLQNRYTLDGNATRETAIPAFDFTGGGTVTLDLIYKDGTFLDGSVPVLTGAAGVITGGANVSSLAVDGVAYAGHVIADGQRCSVSFDLSAGTVDTIGPCGTGGSVANVVLDDGVDYVEYRIDEGFVTTVKAYDRDGVELGLGAEQVTDAFFDTGAGWTFNLGGAWGISGGQAINPGAIGFDTLQTNLGLATGAPREIVIDVESITGTLGVRLGAVTGGSLVHTISTAGRHTIQALPIGTNGVNEWLTLLTNFAGETCTINSVSVRAASFGTITPDAAWTLQPDNSRFYPMGDNDATLKCYDGTRQRKPSADGTIVNHNPANWT